MFEALRNIAKLAVEAATCAVVLLAVAPIPLAVTSS